MERYLSLPLTDKDVREIKAGDIVYLSGEVLQFTAAAHKRALEYADQGKTVPFDVENMAIYHCYTENNSENAGEKNSANESRLECKYLGATTSAGVNPFEPDFIRTFKVRAVVGKGGMDEATLQAMQETGCLYLAQIGGCTQICTEAAEMITAKFWDDLGPNLALKIIFNKLGPLVVGMDANGSSLYETTAAKVEENRRLIHAKIDKGA